MKPKYIFLLLCAICIKLYSQKAEKSRSEELKEKEQYYEKLYIEREGDMEGTGYKDFIRQKRYATPRLDKNGTFESYLYSRNSYYKTQQLVAGTMGRGI